METLVMAEMVRTGRGEVPAKALLAAVSTIVVAHQAAGGATAAESLVAVAVEVGLGAVKVEAASAAKSTALVARSLEAAGGRSWWLRQRRSWQRGHGNVVMVTVVADMAQATNAAEVAAAAAKDAVHGTL